jgi:hypothetical protein|tara:strand:+ start:630 stop:1220 length:591 start_codon:yes stop_codon:yes gene_type:complete
VLSLKEIIMKPIQSKIQFRVFLLALLLCFLVVNPLWGEVDLIDAKKSDTAIKMLIFPKSLRVIESLRSNQINESFSDPKRIKKSLLKLDPARIAPSKMGESVTGAITRNILKHLAKKYSDDVFLVFRRTFNNEKNSIRHQGLLYLAKQRKVLALREIEESSSGSLQEMDLAGLKILAKEAKKVLHSHKYEKRQSAY